MYVKVGDALLHGVCVKLFGQSLELVILDVDGVILDLMYCFEQHFVTIAQAMGYDVDRIRAHFKNYHSGQMMKSGSSLRGTFKEIWPSLNNVELENLMCLFALEEERRPYPEIAGSFSTIDWLTKNNILVALCTNNTLEGVKKKFEPVGLDIKLFSAFGTCDSGYHKPQPEILEMVLDRFSVRRNNIVYVGDNYADIEVTAKVGIPFLAVTSGGLPRSAFIREGVADDHILERLSDIQKIIELE